MKNDEFNKAILPVTLVGVVVSAFIVGRKITLFNDLLPKHQKKMRYLKKFWNDSRYALKEYINKSPSNDLIGSIENELGYKLPASYIELMKQHNGGIPFNTCFPTKSRTSYSKNKISISGIYGIGREKKHSLCGELGSQFMIDEWGYPAYGVYICDCPSAGHDMILLDYRKCGKNGEPEVVHVDQDNNFKITFLAKDFQTFIKGLISESEILFL